jgi:Glycosyltransferase sugar-binding region containing DXD motif
VTGGETHDLESPIVQYWHEERPPEYISGLLETYHALNPDRPHLVFNEASADAFIEGHFGQRYLDAFRACAIPAMQSDYLRYCAVLALGGVYCDADSRCIARLHTIFPSDGRGQVFLRPSGRGVYGSPFAFCSPGSALLELTLEVVTTNIERRIDESAFGVTGPFTFTLLYRLHQLGSFAALLEQMATRRFAALAGVVCEVVGDYGLVTRAFEDITLSSASQNIWIRAPECPLPYKETEAHWLNATTIYRE